jgi:hypothetical protein
MRSNAPRQPGHLVISGPGPASVNLSFPPMQRPQLPVGPLSSPSGGSFALPVLQQQQHQQQHTEQRASALVLGAQLPALSEKKPKTFGSFVQVQQRTAAQNGRWGPLKLDGAPGRPLESLR